MTEPSKAWPQEQNDSLDDLYFVGRETITFLLSKAYNQHTRILDLHVGHACWW